SDVVPAEIQEAVRDDGPIEQEVVYDEELALGPRDDENDESYLEEDESEMSSGMEEALLRHPAPPESERDDEPEESAEDEDDLMDFIDSVIDGEGPGKD